MPASILARCSSILQQTEVLLPVLGKPMPSVRSTNDAERLKEDCDKQKHHTPFLFSSSEAVLLVLVGKIWFSFHTLATPPTTAAAG